MFEQSEGNVRVLAVYPVSRGFGFAVFDDADSLHDWGVKRTPHTPDAHCLGVVSHLTSRYLPDVVVTESFSDVDSRTSRRIRHLLKRIAKLDGKGEITFDTVSRSQVKGFFARAGATTKQQIAVALAKQFPELYYSLPRPRKPWMSEDSRMSIFEAAALALTYYSRSDSKPI